MRNYIKIARGYEEDLQAAVAYQGPVSAAVDASHNIFRVSVMRQSIHSERTTLSTDIGQPTL